MRRFFWRAKWDRERTEEIEAYLRIETDENEARGMPHDEALAAARRKLGNHTLIREEIYRMNTLAFLDSMGRDASHGLRALRHNPVFTAAALATLAIGIGANTAVFSVIDSVLLRPLAYPHPEELVAVRQLAPGAAGLANVSDGLRLSASMYLTYAEHNRAFQSIGVWANATASVTGLAEPEQVRMILVSDGALDTLGTPPSVGRWLLAADQIPGAPQTVMLSYGYWQRRFAGDRAIAGRKIMVDGRPREIAGVMPRNFRFVQADFDLIVPLAFDRSKLSLPGFGFAGIARLKPGVTIPQANADLARMLPLWMRSWPFSGNPQIYETWRITPSLRPLKEEVVGSVGSVLWVVMGTIGVVMLMACANVTNLLLVRAEARQHELALRAALGAGQARIVRGLLTESVLLGLGGGVLGIAFAYGGLRLLAALGPANLPRLDEISLDGAGLAFSLALSVVSGLLFGAIPALKYGGARVAGNLRGAGRTSSASRERHRTRNVLVIAQVAMAMVLLVSAGLMIRTFQALRRVQPGFTHAEQLQTVRISIPPSLIAEPERVTRLQNDITERLAQIPGVTSAAFASAVPMDGIPPNWDAVFVEGSTYAPGELPPLRQFQYVSPGFFHTAGTRLMAGRDLTWTDVYGQRRFVIVSENLARELWGSAAAALGKRFNSGGGRPWWEVIGVVEDVRENGVHEPPPEIVYWPTLLRNLYGPGPLAAVQPVTFVVRSMRAGSEDFLKQMRDAVWSANASLPLASVKTMQEVYEASLARTSFTLVMLAIAGAVALALGIIGIYGVISYAVSQRRREIGIRLALGAPEAELKRMFVRHGLTLSAVGVVLGLGTAAGVMRLMRSLLFGIGPLDPVTYAAVGTGLAMVAALASYVPARRAAAVDPVEALRAE